MIRKLAHIVRNHLKSKAVVLMYHRIYSPASDIWDIAVSPATFEQQLKVLKNKYNVVSLEEMIQGLKKKSLKNNCIAITFDDGCLDNFTIAKPLLEKYHLPATFFVPSGFVDGQKAFWWNVIEDVFLHAPKLPKHLSIEIDGNQYDFHLENEAELTAEIVNQHKNWKANDSLPPTLRADCYFKIWQKLRILPPQAIDDVMSRIESWANNNSKENSSYCMSLNHILDLDANPLFNVESHSCHHSALAYHDKSFQKNQILNDKLFWELELKRKVKYLAYPYGNYNQDTQSIARDLEFNAAFSTEEKYIHNQSNIFALPRYQVKSWNEDIFDKSIKNWMK